MGHLPPAVQGFFYAEYTDSMRPERCVLSTLGGGERQVAQGRRNAVGLQELLYEIYINASHPMLRHQPTGILASAPEQKSDLLEVFAPAWYSIWAHSSD